MQVVGVLSICSWPCLPALRGRLREFRLAGSLELWTVESLIGPQTRRKAFDQPSLNNFRFF